MRILFADVLSHIGHKNYNYSLLDILSRSHHIDTVFKEGYLSGYKNAAAKIDNIYDIPTNLMPKPLRIKKGFVHKLLFRVSLYRIMKWVENLAEQNSYDLVIFSSIEIISFFAATIRLKKRYVFVDHGITYLNKSKIKRFFWKHINQNAEAIVMEDYIKGYLENNLKIKNNIWLVRHPLANIDAGRYQGIINGEKMIFAPSGSNDEAFISFLIENNNRISDYKILIRSKKRDYKTDNLVVYNNRITDGEYW